MGQKQWVTGDVGHGFTDAGTNQPVKIGGIANAAEQAAVDESDRSQIGVDLRGNQKMVGNIAHDTADRGDPVKVGGIARTANPTAVADSDRVNATFDDLGRQIIAPYQVRDLVVTAFAETATLAEVTLLAGATSAFNDLIEITCANQSGAAVTLSLRDSTGGTVIRTLVLPATATQGFRYPVPVPQNTTATAWTIQNAGSGDISTTVVSVSALFVRNV